MLLITFIEIVIQVVVVRWQHVYMLSGKYWNSDKTLCINYASAHHHNGFEIKQPGYDWTVDL